jgi:hypothetical protein
MNIIKKTVLGMAALGLTSFASVADIYNHGNHNDPHYTYSEGTISTIDCGSSSLATCINQGNIEAFAKGRCEAIKNVGGLPQWGAPYWHTIQQYAVRPVSAIDGNNGTGANDYTVDVIFSCGGLLHPGIKMLPGGL